MSSIYVVGRTDEREVYVASQVRAFVMNEYLLIEDEEHDIPVGEIIGTYAYPFISENTFPSELGIKESVDHLFNYENNTLKKMYIGKLKMLSEYQTPIMSHSKLRVPNFDNVQSQLMPTQANKGLTLGVVKGTSSLVDQLPEELKDVAPLYNANIKKVLPQNGVPFVFDYKSFKEYPHMGFFGGSGSGKTFGLRVTLEELMKYSLPGIVFDPHYEMDFSSTMTGLKESQKLNLLSRYEIFEIGQNVGINFSELNSSEIVSLLEFVADLSQPMKGAIESLHESKDSFITLTNRITNLKKAFENMERAERDREELSKDITLLYYKHRDNVAGLPTLQAILWRLDQLEKTGLFNCDITHVESAILNRKLAIIRGKQKHLQMIASYLIGKLYHKRRYYKDWQQISMHKRNTGSQPEKFPPFFVIMDEAHIFAPNGMQSNPTKRILREIAQEARKYGVIEIFGTQRPSLLDTTITAQLNTKVIFRTGIKEDMEMIEKETNLNDDQVKRLPELTSGNAFVSSATLSKTMYVQFRVTKTESPHGKNPFDELEEFDSTGKLKGILMEMLPLSDSSIQKVHSEINQKMNKAMTIKEIQETLEVMANYKEIIKEKSPFGNKYKKSE